jgi:hypothetical protein
VPGKVKVLMSSGETRELCLGRPQSKAEPPDGMTLNRWTRMLAVGLVGMLCVAMTAAQTAKTPRRGKVGIGNIVVKGALGGSLDIAGYDVDQNGTEGLITEALGPNNQGRYDVAVETFDQKTGKYIKIAKRLNNVLGDFVTLGIFGDSPKVGLYEYEHVSKIYVNKRLYGMLNPLDSGKLTGPWTPPLGVEDIITKMSGQGFPNAAVFGFHNSTQGNSLSFVLGSNVGANKFGKVITLTDPVLAEYDSPVMAYDGKTNTAVVAASPGCSTCGNTIALVDLSTGKVKEFQGLGIGFVNGIAVDSNTGIACTTTEIDASLEFYDLAKQTGFIVPIPHAGQLNAGLDVEVDPIHKLFLIGQEFSSFATSGSSILVFDEKGNFVEALNGFNLPASPVYMALHPSDRSGFVYNELRQGSSNFVVQSFTY